MFVGHQREDVDDLFEFFGFLFEPVRDKLVVADGSFQVFHIEVVVRRYRAGKREGFTFFNG